MAETSGRVAERLIDAFGIRGVLASPELPCGDALILTHGAGSGHNAGLLQSVAAAFAATGWTVLRYDLPFRQERPKGPPIPARAALDREGILKAAEFVRTLVSGRIFAGGHSYGGRQTAMTAAEHPGLFAGLLLLSYPLHPPGKPENLRTAFFPQLRTPALFTHGDRDPFGSVDEMRAAIVTIPAAVELLPVAGAGHALAVSEAILGELPLRLRNLLKNAGQEARATQIETL